MDAQLLQRCRDQDRQAQQELYHATLPQIYALLLRMTGSPHDAADLSQETYVRAYTHLDQFDGRSSFVTWLHRIAVNEALQFLRRADRQRDALQTYAAQNPAHKATSSPSSRIQDLQEAVTRLDPLDRALLSLRYQGGLDYRTLADVLDIPAGTVASRLNRARERLRILLQPGPGRPEEMEAPPHRTTWPAFRPQGDFQPDAPQRVRSDSKTGKNG